MAQPNKGVSAKRKLNELRGGNIQQITLEKDKNKQLGETGISSISRISVVNILALLL